MKNGGNWILRYETYDPKKQGLHEALCTLGNGYFATRGAFPEAKADEIHYPGTYIAGAYNRLKTEIVGRVIENEDLVNMPNWLPLTFRIDEGEWFQIGAVEIVSFNQELNLKEGTLSRLIRFKDAHNRETTLSEIRFVHMREQHLAAIQWKIKAENWSGKVEVCSALDGNVKNEGVLRYRDLNCVNLTPLEEGVTKEGHTYLKVETNQSELRVAEAARTKVFLKDESVVRNFEVIRESGYIAQIFSETVLQGEELSIEKVVALYTSRDFGISECCKNAQLEIKRAPGFDTLLQTHKSSWGMYWNEFDIEIETVPEVESHFPLLTLRAHIFHLLQTVSFNTIGLDVGVPARGWHGEAYRGHIFWDELFIFPILNLRIPKITQSLLKYRFRRLDEARENAKDAGFKGAMFPWQSGSTGREESQQVHLNPKSGRWIPDHSYIQRHVNIAIAYNVWRYYEITDDLDFLRTYGAEMLIEISRFIASLSSYNAEIDRYEILKVMGPDEYHDAYPDSEEPGLDNNAYTNVMAAWVLSRTLQTLKILPYDHLKEIKSLLNLQDSEMVRWQEISEKMRVVFHDDGIISQFEGYDQLKEFPWEEYRKKYGDIQRLDRILESEGDSPNRYKLSKQADLLMLFYLFSAEELKEVFDRLGYDFDSISIPKNVDYYLERTSHGSTLSRIVHSWVLSRENRPESWDLFIDALESDVADIQGGTTPEGVHLGAMAGTVDIVQRCYTGIETRDEVLWFNPSLPGTIKRMKCHIHYRGHSIEVELDHKILRLTDRHTAAEKVKVGVYGQIYELITGDVLSFELDVIKEGTP